MVCHVTLCINLALLSLIGVTLPYFPMIREKELVLVAVQVPGYYSVFYRVHLFALLEFTCLNLDFLVHANLYQQLTQQVFCR
jgi:hypothetical protein